MSLFRPTLTRELTLTRVTIRIVRNDTMSKPLSRGVLDGQLIAAFEAQGVLGQTEMTRQIGTERGGVLRDWSGLVVPW